MAVIALASAKGSPGATTAALGLALHWPRPVVLVEADTAGGSSILAGYLRGTVAHERGLLDLALAQGLGDPVGPVLESTLIPLPGAGHARLLAGVATSAQGGSLSPMWPPLAEHLASLRHGGTDAIVDLGRADAEHFAAGLAIRADLLLLALRSDLPSVVAARARVPVLKAEADRSGVPVLALLVGPGRPYSEKEIAGVLGLQVATTLDWDPAGAAVLSHGEGRAGQRRGLGRSLRAAVADIRTALDSAPAASGRLP